MRYTKKTTIVILTFTRNLVLAIRSQYIIVVLHSTLLLNDQ